MLSRFKIDNMWYAVATLVGSTVGVGIYAIPFTFQKATLGVGLLFFLVVGGLVLLSNLLYGEIILRTARRHQFVGYVNKYLGAWPRRINVFNFWVSLYGSMIAIIIIAGGFLSTILSGLVMLSPVVFSTIFILFISILVALGLRTVARVDFWMMLLFIGIVLIITLVGLPHIQLSNFQIPSTGYWFLPFGVILFALTGVTGVPLAREYLVGQEQKFKKVLVLGTLIPVALYLLFTLVVLGISGDATSPDALSGLRSVLGSKIIILGSLFGFLTSSTIFLNMATALKESLHQDFHFKNRFSWIFIAVVPYLLFLSGIRNFIDIIGLVGGIAISIDMILLVFVYVQARRHGERVPEYSVRLPKSLLYTMMTFFLAAAAYTLIVK